MHYYILMIKKLPKSIRLIFLLTIHFLFFSSGVSLGQENEIDTDSKQMLIESIKDWVSSYEGINKDSITVFADDRRFRVPSCDDNYTVGYAFNTKNTVTAECVETSWRASIRIEIKKIQDVFAYKNDLGKGEYLNSDDLLILKIDDSVKPSMSLNASTNKDEILGKMLRVDVRSGQILEPNHFENNVIVYEAKNSIQKNTVIREDDVLSIEVPSSTVLFQERIDKNKLIGSTLIIDIDQGERFTLSSLSNVYKAMIVNQLIERGQRIDENNSSLVDIFEEPPSDTITEISMIDRAISVRRLLPGSVLKFSDIEILPHISKEKEITLYLRMNNLTLTTEVIALEDGYIGDTIKVLNKESGEEINARVTDVGIVEISRLNQ